MSTTPRYDAALADELNVANPQELHRAHERTLLALLEVEQERNELIEAIDDVMVSVALGVAPSKSVIGRIGALRARLKGKP